jgi:hypothetical protein
MLALPLAEYSQMVSLICAAFEDRLIFLDYGQRFAEPCYTCICKIGSGDVARDIENVTGLSRNEGYATVTYRLVSEPPVE